MSSTKELRTKIKSVGSTKKITQAMQMVAASKMQKAIDNNKKSRAYSSLAWEVVQDVAASTDVSHHPLLATTDTSGVSVVKIVLIVVTSNRGLCAGFNANVIKKTMQFINENKDKEISLITVGQKGARYLQRFYKDKIVADFPLSEAIVSFSDITPIAKIAIDDFATKKYSQVVVIYNHFVSKMTQEATVRQLLPIIKSEEEFPISNSQFPNKFQISNNKLQNRDEEKANEAKKFTPLRNEVSSAGLMKLKSYEYQFEPDIRFVLDTMLPQIIKTQIFQILLESNASEHSARMIAMKNATDNASDLIDDLTLTYNSIRQAAITSEIAEISAGAEALKI